MMEKKLSAGKVESEDVPLEAGNFMADMDAYTDVEYGILKIFIDDRDFDNVKGDIAADE